MRDRIDAFVSMYGVSNKHPLIGTSVADSYFAACQNRFQGICFLGHDEHVSRVQSEVNRLVYEPLADTLFKSLQMFLPACKAIRSKKVLAWVQALSISMGIGDLRICRCTNAAIAHIQE